MSYHKEQVHYDCPVLHSEIERSITACSSLRKFGLRVLCFKPCVRRCGNFWKPSRYSCPEESLIDTYKFEKTSFNLAFSDLAVGLFPQPMFAVIVAMMLRMAANSNYNFDFLCPVILNVGYFTFFLLGCASFLTIAVITVDRILAIFLHLRYHELVTSERVVISLVCLWLTSAIAASILLSVPTLNQIVTAIILFTGLSLTTIAYILIYKVVKYHRNQIHHQHQITNAQDLNYLREKKSTFNALFVYIVFTACYFPHLCSVILLIANSSQLSFLVVEHISLFLLLLNSSLNPLVCYWRYGELRAIINGTLMKIFHI